MTSRPSFSLAGAPALRAVPAYTVASCRLRVARGETEDELVRRLIEALRGFERGMSHYYTRYTSRRASAIIVVIIISIISCLLFYSCLFCISAVPVGPCSGARSALGARSPNLISSGGFHFLLTFFVSCLRCLSRCCCIALHPHHALYINPHALFCALLRLPLLVNFCVFSICCYNLSPRDMES